MGLAAGGAATALVTAHAADAVLAQQRAERRSVRAVLLDDVPRATPAIGTTTDRRTAAVGWTTSDGSTHPGRTLVDTGLQAGSKVTVRQDGRGRLTSAPPDPTEAAIESGFLAATATAALGGPVFAGGAVARRPLDRRRSTGTGAAADAEEIATPGTEQVADLSGALPESDQVTFAHARLIMRS
ncbi:hypothetical protein SAMN05216533_0729 [Streptomyces sp. Ag109_O5-10]|nr:hypothetical protein SAMN05216533_0729 [Streptomyces sp. Ag109_O5-10]